MKPAVVPPECVAKPGEPTKSCGRWSLYPGRWKADQITFPAFVSQLEYVVHRTVMDRTNLSGVYDFDLHWSENDESGNDDLSSATNSAAAKDSGPSIFTALEEQLGLKLVPTKGPVETLIIDQAQKPSPD